MVLRDTFPTQSRLQVTLVRLCVCGEGTDLHEWGLTVSVFPRLQKECLTGEMVGCTADPVFTALRPDHCPSRPLAPPSSPCPGCACTQPPRAPRPQPGIPACPSSRLGAPGALSKLDVDGTWKVTPTSPAHTQWPLRPETFEFPSDPAARRPRQLLSPLPRSPRVTSPGDPGLATLSISERQLGASAHPRCLQPAPPHLQSSTWTRPHGRPAPWPRPLHWPRAHPSRCPLPGAPVAARGAALGPGGPALRTVHFPWDTRVCGCLTDLEVLRVRSVHGSVSAAVCGGVSGPVPCWPADPQHTPEESWVGRASGLGTTLEIVLA